MHDTKSSVSFQNLIRDLAEMYPFEGCRCWSSWELIANPLDAGGDPSLARLMGSANTAVVCKQRGMSAAQFMGITFCRLVLKTRGTGMGSAGVGAKISFNIGDRVQTETRSALFFHRASTGSPSRGGSWFGKMLHLLIF
jgi:hypothetical protein